MMERETHFKRLLGEQFDLLVVGGGATGAGIALDASLRGYKTALIEAADFSSGASSCSTKLLHGGVRYLERAFLRFDWQQLRFVRDSLHERATLMQIAPHLTRTVPIILPVYSRCEKLYYWTGLKLYEWLSGSRRLEPCKALNAGEVGLRLPGISSSRLKGGILYVDGQFDDARFNIALIQTAIERGCVALNYVKLNQFLKSAGHVCGAVVEDRIGGTVAEIKAKVVVNASGCFADTLRQMDQPAALPLLAPSRGSHIVIKKKKLPLQAGFLIPGTENGKIVFGFPWKGNILIGTTDVPSPAQSDPQPSEDEIAYLLNCVQRYFSTSLCRADVVAAWAGIRPLYKGERGAETLFLSRDHHIERSPSRLYSIVGGKWTTYRLMAKDLVDTVIADGALDARAACTTGETALAGADDYSARLGAELAHAQNLPQDIAQHLAHSYGGRAALVLKYFEEGLVRRLHADFPYVEAEVAYVLQHEYACNAKDILYRRLRLGFLDQQAALAVEQRINEIIAICQPKSKKGVLNCEIGGSC